MAAVIMIIAKPTSNKKAQQFFNTVDQYVESQGLVITDRDYSPRTYFSEMNIPPTKVRGLINTIKATEGYGVAVKSILFSASLIKG